MITTEVQIRVGSAFTIRLESNPTTGYSWVLDYDHDHLDLVSEDYERISMSIGGGGVSVFKFVSLKRGTTIIITHYQRPWEDEAIEVRRFSVDAY
jgi:inhibitor of cysteine peptidase